ncbi:MAG: PEP-CTERM sorting domain-containing protein [Microcystis panniformis]
MLNLDFDYDFTGLIPTSEVSLNFNLGGDGEAVASVPEPTSIISLFSLGILGAGATLKRKVKRSHSLEKEPSNVG